jgi:hypothetical protein
VGRVSGSSWLWGGGDTSGLAYRAHWRSDPAKVSKGHLRPEDVFTKKTCPPDRRSFPNDTVMLTMFKTEILD